MAVKEYSFHNYAKPVNKNVFTISVAGDWDTKKTGTMMTLPDPIVLFAFAGNYSGPVNRAVEMGKKITVIDVPVPEAKFKFNIQEEGAHKSSQTDYDSAESVGVWQEFKKMMLAAKRDPKLKTIVVDTVGQMKRLATLAHFHRLTAIKPTHRGRLNSDIANLCDQFKFEKGCDKNVVFISHLKKKYIRKPGDKDDNAEWLGDWEVDGCEPYMSQLVDVHLWAKQGEVMPNGRRQVTWTIQKCNDNDVSVGMQLNFLDEDGEETGELSWDYLEPMISG